MKNKNKAEYMVLYVNIATWAVLALLAAIFAFQEIVCELRAGHFMPYYLQLSGVICLTGLSVIALSITTLWQMDDGHEIMTER